MTWDTNTVTCCIIIQEADGLVHAYILIWVAKNCGRSATDFEGVFLGFYIEISQKIGLDPQKLVKPG